MIFKNKRQKADERFATRLKALADWEIEDLTRLYGDNKEGMLSPVQFAALEREAAYRKANW